MPAVNDTTTPLPELTMSTFVPGGNVPGAALTVTMPLLSGIVKTIFSGSYEGGVSGCVVNVTGATATSPP